MTAIDLIRSFTTTAVIIDDGYLPPQLEMIQQSHWAELRDRESETHEIWEQIRKEQFSEVLRVIDLKRSDENQQKAWQLYAEDPEKYSIFDPIFSHILATTKVKISPLKELVDYLEKEVGLTVLKRPSLSAAAEDIKKSKLIFLDFWLYQTTEAKIIEDLRNFADIFSSPVIEGAESHGRFVFLISTDLPAPNVLDNFRTTTKLKSAFFKPVGKNSLNKPWLEAELSSKVGRYGDMWKLSQYLDTFSRQISEVSSALQGEIESLELHDLAILNNFRLDKESENLGDYLSWLLSEALAAKIRASSPLLDAARTVGQIHGVPFHGTLTPKQILFDLYSEIAFSTPYVPKIQFGDVLALATQSKAQVNHLPTHSAGTGVHQEDLAEGAEPVIANTGAVLAPVVATSELSATGTILNNQEPLKAPVQTEGPSANTPQCDPDKKCELLLVISPACDLQRCNMDDEVLCVRGRITKESADLSDLLGQSPFFGKGVEDFKHLLRTGAESDVKYSLVEWYPKAITTQRASALMSSSYVRRAKLNELFAQEVKEEALRQVGRVGIPVDPSFSTSLGATWRFKMGRKQYVVREILDTEFIAGIFISANNQNVARITLSEEFLSVLHDEVVGLEKNQPCPLDAKTLAHLHALQTCGSSGLTLNKKNEIQYEGGLRIRFVSEYFRDSKIADNEIVFYPRGKIQNAVVEEPEAASASPVASVVAAQ